MAEVSTEAIASLAQYYDQPLRCFTFGDFQLSPTVEEFEEILGCPLGGRKPYLFSRFYPSLARISKIVQISTQELDHRKQVKMWWLEYQGNVWKQKQESWQVKANGLHSWTSWHF